MSNPHSLDPLFSPRSVAVIGASRNPMSVGGDVLRNLRLSGFNGPVYPVNPNAEYVASTRAWPSIEAIPGPVDLAVVCVPSQFVLEVVEQCARKGVKALAVLTAGFREVGGAGVARERALQQRARSLGMRLLGPNCLGVVNTDPAVSLNATFAPHLPPEGSVAFSSQSGALGVAILEHARRLGIGISHFASVGNKADVSGNDLLEYWEHDARTRVILFYLESFGNPRRFANIARRVSLQKPILAVKSGRTQAGARAASSHTGSLAGTDRAAEALFEHTGVIRVDTVEELFDVAMLVANQPLPAGNRVAIVSNAGGPGILATDACVHFGLEVPKLDPATVASLQGSLAAEASAQNPVDMIASADAAEMKASVAATLKDPNIDALLVLFVPTGHSDVEAVANAIVEGSRGIGKPVMTCFMGTHGVPETLRSEAVFIPSYTFPEAAARALGHAARYASWRRMVAAETPTTPPTTDAARAQAAIETAEPGAWLSNEAVSEVMLAYGIPYAPTRLVSSVDDAVAMSERLGFPVVLKAEAVGLVHKSDQGGVALDLNGAAAIRSAWAAFEGRFGARLQGALVQPMVIGATEVIVGATSSDGGIPLVMFGMGGVLVELLQDVAFGLAPLCRDSAERLVSEVRASKLLDGFRGQPAGDREALVDVLLRVSLLAADHPEVAELDLNPVLARRPGEGVLAVDARIRRAEQPETH